MKFTTTLCLLLLGFSGLTVALGNTAPAAFLRVHRVRNHSLLASYGNLFDLTHFGAVGDGVTDNGPALQNALDAMGEAGGGTLFVPAGRYAIHTPVQKDFTGLASDISILGVESLTPVPPPTSSGQVLSHGLDLVSEFAPRTGGQGIAIHIKGLRTFLIKDITFIGTPGVLTDALITLALSNIRDATIKHCEFYGLSSLAAGGAIVQSFHSGLNLQQSVFLGCATNSGVYGPIVQNLEWNSIAVTDAIFIDYGQRAELYGKLNLAAPLSWVNIGNAAALTSDSPRREVVIRSVFLDEGGFIGLSSLPYRYLPPSAPIDLLYVSGLYMNVSNLNASGNYLYGPKRVLIEKSHYGWSHRADSAINLVSVGNAILDRVECVESADRIRADSATGKLTVIDSVYNHLDSLAQNTRIITAAAPDDDPVQYVRRQFGATLGRDPDPAAHFYWSDQILQCGLDLQCVAAKRSALGNYLATAPQEKFAVSGQVVDEDGAGLGGVAVTLVGSQNVTTQTDAEGRYQFYNLPTSDVYTIIPSRRYYTLSPASYQIVTPAADQTFNSIATFNHHYISGQVTDHAGNALPGVIVTLSGSQNTTTTTGADGEYSFADLPAARAYTVTPSKTSYSFTPAAQTFNDLESDEIRNFSGSFVTYTIAGIVVGINNNPITGATVILSGSVHRTATSDGAGCFSFTGLPSEGTYTITPTLIGYSFNPLSITYDSLSANHDRAFVATQTNHSISGRVTQSGSRALSGATVSLSGYTNGTATTDANGDYSFPNLPHGGDYALTVSKAYCTFSAPSQIFNNLISDQIANFEGSQASVLEFSAASYSVAEGTPTITVTVEHKGDTSSATEVTCSASDGSALQRNDVIPVIGRLRFEPGETSKSFIIFVTDDTFIEGNESITLKLNHPVGSLLGNQGSAMLTLTDNDSSTTAPNPIDDAQFFVVQHYRDFLNRSPDDAGLAFWSNQILSCGTEAACIADRRMNVSAAFFLSIEFQETGFLVYRLYRASSAMPPEHLNEFLFDTRTIREGVVVNTPGWQQLLEANKTIFIESFVARPRFKEAYSDDLTPEEFVNQLNAKAGGPLSPNEITAAVAEFAGAATSDALPARARVLRRVAESQPFSQRELNPAFVLMQYFGYLQRNPDELPDTNLDGYNYWLRKLEEFGGDFRRAEMVKAFLLSTEYRARFGTP